MSVIAKMNVYAARDFGSGSLIELGCVCENDLMTAYATSNEDKLFTEYSPWGEARVNLFPGVRIPFAQDQFYVVAIREGEFEGKPLPGAAFVLPARCSELAELGDANKRVEFTFGWRKTEGSQVSGFNWRMTVNNPGALAQFVPGADDYWVGFYPVSGFDLQAALNNAHGPDLEGAAEAEVEVEDEPETASA